VPWSKYHRALLLSYPDVEDAKRGEALGLVTPRQRRAIEHAQQRCSTPPQRTRLGGYLEIHGHGGSRDWTEGCIAIENAPMDRLWKVLGTGDTVVIRP
jgi:murein L,D-transpeptidase YafK